ncbi:MAG: O-antigen ligase family protein [Gemmatimonadales bacterium]
MTAITICLLAFAFTFWARTQSRSAGLLSVLAFGYSYGILRANLTTAGYFIFDSAAAGLYLAELRTHLSPAQRLRENRLRDWVVALALVPSLLLLLPRQDVLVQLVGFRSAILFLPFILLGARLERDDFRKLAIGVAILNLVAFSFAGYEFVNGINSLYPVTSVTSIIYRSTLQDASFYRIPATFSSSASYGGTMVVTIPLLGMAISGKHVKGLWYAVCFAGLAIGTVGVFVSASRSTAVLAIVALVAILIQNRRTPRVAMALAGGAIIVATLVASQTRLQRFLSLGDTEYVAQRLIGSANAGIVDIVMRYPFGNGLGAGGTSLPYFIEKRVEGAIWLENEYARLALEQGAIGLFLWIGFIAWVLVPSHGDSRTQGKLAIRILTAAIFATGMVGTGLLAAIPGTCFLFLMIGVLFNDLSPSRAPGRIQRPRGRMVRKPVAPALTATARLPG